MLIFKIPTLNNCRRPVDTLSKSAQTRTHGCPNSLSHPVRSDHRVSLYISALEHRAGRHARHHGGGVAQDEEPDLSPDGAVLDEGVRAYFRDRRGDGHRDGI